jgi:hypothetical protein
MKPGNKAVVHHVIVSIRPPQPTPEQQAQIAAAMKAQAANPASRPQPVFEFADGMEIPAGQTGGPPLEGAAAAAKRPGLLPVDRPRPRGTAGSIGGYVPGNSARILPEGTGIRLPAGSSLVFQMHYTPVGEKTTDRTIVGMKFAKERPKTVLTSSALVNGGLHIPANTADHRIDAEMTINRDVTLWSLVPHTHMRGKKWHYEVIYPDGRKETILSVPNYDFEWQHEYMFSEPLKLPKGTKLHATAWYDNSKNNRYNPDPNAEVWWGDQTWEEMMFTSITFSVVQPTTTTSSQQ